MRLKKEENRCCDFQTIKRTYLQAFLLDAHMPYFPAYKSLVIFVYQYHKVKKDRVFKIFFILNVINA